MRSCENTNSDTTTAFTILSLATHISTINKSQALNQIPYTIDRSTMADANTVYENIKFNPDRTIDRSLPFLLSGTKMTAVRWNTFCDKVDKTMKSVTRAKLLSKYIWAIVLIMIALNFFGWKFAGLKAYYGMIVPVTLLFTILFCFVEPYVVKKVASHLAKECDAASNFDKDVRIRLEGEAVFPEMWYIQVAVRNASIGVPEDDIESAPEMVAMALSDEPPTEEGPPPKKYVKKDGKMILNPDFKLC